jgi:hypothetical protein
MLDYRKVFDAVVRDSRYVSNLDWGKPRRGHPEGTVRAHIAELEINLEKLRPKLNDDDWRLKLLIHTHDSLKAEAQAGVRISDPRSHASLARAFLAEYCEDADLVAMVQYHDEPYALYRQFESYGEYNQDRFLSMVHSIQDWNLFLAFCIIDGCTAGKSREPLRWLFREISGRVQSGFTEADIIP